MVRCTLAPIIARMRRHSLSRQQFLSGNDASEEILQAIHQQTNETAGKESQVRDHPPITNALFSRCI